MATEYDPRILPLAAFARSAATVRGQVALADMPRLQAQTLDPSVLLEVGFEASGSERFDATGHPQVWLHVRGNCSLQLECQRCLRPADMEVAFERDFRFVANEALAAVEDDECEEDVLVFARQFSLIELVEDELLMAMPLVPMHESCPQPPRLAVADPDFDTAGAEPVHPFAVLAGLKRGPSGG